MKHVCLVVFVVEGYPELIWIELNCVKLFNMESTDVLKCIKLGTLLKDYDSIIFWSGRMCRKY